jgi:heat shock protein HslJ
MLNRLELALTASGVASLVALALSALLAIGVVAQDRIEPDDALSIEDTNWLLAAQVVDGELALLDEGVVISLRMAGGDAGGTGGCNSYGVSYDLDGSDIDLNLVFTTAMGCSAPRAAAEASYFANIEQVASYQSDGGTMTLVDDDGEPLLEFGLADPVMVEGSWSLGMVSDGAGSLDGNQHTSRMTATFAGDGSLAGTDGCNDYSATYELAGQDIRIGPITTTDRRCEKKRQRTFAQRYYTALETTATWSIGMLGLELRDEDGVVQVLYDRAE